MVHKNIDSDGKIEISWEKKTQQHIDLKVFPCFLLSVS